MLNRIYINNLAAYALIATILFFYAAAVLSAQTSFSIFPAYIEYKEDFNKDGQADISDVVSLIALGLKVPESPPADYNRDSVFNVVDVLNLLLNIKNGKLTPLIPQDTSSNDTTSSDTTGTQTTWMISGYVYCLYGVWGNVQIFLAGDLEATTFTDANGFYFFQVLNGNYTIIPAQVNEYGYNPPSRTVVVNGGDLQRLDFFVYGYESVPGL